LLEHFKLKKSRVNSIISMEVLVFEGSLPIKRLHVSICNSIGREAVIWKNLWLLVLLVLVDFNFRREREITVTEEDNQTKYVSRKGILNSMFLPHFSAKGNRISLSSFQ